MSQNIIQYKSIDEDVAESARKAFLRHTWYLVGEMIPIATWDEDLIENERRRLADTIVKLPAKSSFALRVGNGWGKPNLASVNITKEHLEQYVTTDSKMFFEILKLSTYFL